MGAAKIHDQQNWRKNRPSDGREPHGRARKIDMVKDNGAACDHRRHPGNSAEEKVERNLPGPNRRFDHRLTVVTGFSRNRTAGNIDTCDRPRRLLPKLPRATLRIAFRMAN